MKDLIEFNKGQKPVFSPIALSIREFKAIWKRDKNNHKNTALKELAYVAFCHDYRSPYFSEEPNDRMHKLIRDLELPEKWRPDAVIEKAEKKYIERTDTPALRALRTNIDVINLSQEGVSFAKESISKSLKELELLNEMDVDHFEYEDEEGKAKQLAKMIDKAKKHQDNIIENVKRLLDLSGKMEPAIASQEKLIERIQKAEAEGSAVKGGGEIGEFED